MSEVWILEVHYKNGDYTSFRKRDLEKLRTIMEAYIGEPSVEEVHLYRVKS